MVLIIAIKIVLKTVTKIVLIIAIKIVLKTAIKILLKNVLKNVCNKKKRDVIFKN